MPSSRHRYGTHCLTLDKNRQFCVTATSGHHGPYEQDSLIINCLDLNPFLYFHDA